MSAEQAAKLRDVLTKALADPDTRMKSAYADAIRFYAQLTEKSCKE